MFSRVLSLASRSTVSPAYVWCNAVTAQTYRSFFSTEAGQAEQKYENVIVEKKGNVGILTLNRPKTLHALCDALVKDVNNALTEFQNDDEIGAVVLTGAGKKSFAAGADISEVREMDNTLARLFAGYCSVCSSKLNPGITINKYRWLRRTLWMLTRLICLPLGTMYLASASQLLLLSMDMLWEVAVSWP